MAEKNLEVEKPQVEEVEPTPTEEVTPTEPKVEPTVVIEETEAFRHALDKALGKSTESLQRQTTLAKQGETAAKAEIDQHKANVASLEAEKKDIQGQFDDLASRQFEDDGDKRTYLSGIQNQRIIADTKRELTKREAEVEKKLYNAEKLAFEVIMNRKIDWAVKETGLERAGFMDCTTEAEVEAKTYKHLASNPKPEKPEPKTPKFDSALPSGGGQEMPESAKSKIKAGWEELHKK